MRASHYANDGRAETHALRLTVSAFGCVRIREGRGAVVPVFPPRVGSCPITRLRNNLEGRRSKRPHTSRLRAQERDEAENPSVPTRINTSQA